MFDPRLFVRRSILLRTTVGSEAAAQSMALRLVAPHLAACVHVHAVRSHYVWDGARRDEAEWVVEARVPLGRRVKRVRLAMLEGHPYELPVVESFGVFVNKPYLDWMRSG